jgi:hypothetical protein
MPLYKAQMGGGTEQNEMNARMATSIQQAIKRGQTPQDIYESLIARKMDQKLAMQLVSSVVKYMMEAGELEEESLAQAEQKDAAEIQAMEQEKMLMANEKDAAAQQQMDTYRQQSMAAAMDTSEADMAEEEDANSTEEIFGFQDGGEQVSYESVYQNADGTDVAEEVSASDGKFNLDALIENTAGTQNLNFPGLEQYYIPYSPLAADSLELPDMSMPTAKYGGSHKKQFAKNVMNLLKKQTGGMQEDEVVDSSIAKQTDDLTGTVKKKKTSFVDAVGNTAKKVKIDEWFEKLKETQDPLLDQILSPVPQGDPAQEQQMQMNQAMGEDQMRRGGQKKAKRKYRNLIERTNKLLGVEGAYPSDFGDIPMNTYNKSYPFIQQSFETIDVPTLEKYFSDLANAPTIQQDQPLMPMIDVYETGFFGRPKKYRILYPQASKGTAEQQAEEATLKNNIENDPNAKVTVNETQVNLQVPGDPKEMPSTDFIQGYASGGQYGGFVDPSLPDLTRFVYGGNDFPEEAKNVNDPYFTDMGQYQDGGMMFPNPDEDPENPMHHLNMYSQASDIFHQPMNTVEQAKRGGPTKADARRARRAINATLRDNLIPINRFIDYEGSYAQQMGMPTIYNSDAIYSGSMTGAPLVFSDVTKRGILGAPKQWTDYYMVEDDGSNVDLSQHPMLQQYQQSAEQGSDDYSDLGIRARRAINKGERQTERQLARAERKGYNEPTPNSKNRSPEEFAASLGYPDVETLKKAINERTIKNFDIPEDLSKQIMEYQDGGSPEDENFEFYRRLEKGMYTPPPMMRRGGRLPMAFEGLENTPVSYTSNPAFEGQREVDFTVAPGANTNLPVKSYWDAMGANAELDFNQNPQFTPPVQPEQINIRPENVEEYQATKSTTAPKMPDPIKGKTLVQVNRQREDIRTVDPEAALNMFNSAASFGLGLAGRKDQREQERQMYEQNFNPMKLYGTKARRDRGDWEVNQGSYRDPGSIRLGRSKQFGGPMTDPNEDDITYMTDEQIQEFMAAGGEIEFL